MAVRRRVRLLSVPFIIVSVASGVVFTVGTAAGPAAATCTQRVLVLSAMPLELDPLLANQAATIDPGSQVYLNNRAFVTGTLAHHQVVLGLTGIGPENALTTTTAAFSHYQCGDEPGISAVVFSGTAGGAAIGSVYVPNRWTEDGTTFYASDPGMLAAASSATSNLALEQTTPTGDPACVCALAGGVQTPVTVQDTPEVHVGGDGLTTDPFNGHAAPCAPAGSDIASCVPCRELDQSQVAQAAALAQGVPPLVDPGFVTSNLQPQPPGDYVSSDEETAVVAEIAAQHGVPFIGFRAASDGPGNTPGTGGDPLMLPGFPFQFAVYRQLAADNAATAAVAFLGAWEAGD